MSSCTTPMRKSMPCSKNVRCSIPTPGMLRAGRKAILHIGSGGAFSCRAVLPRCITKARGFTGLNGEWYTHAHHSKLSCKGNIVSAQNKQLAHRQPTIQVLTC